VSTDGSSINRPLLTHEIGSLDKPGWRVKAYAGKKLEGKDIDEARTWGERVQVPHYEELLDLLAESPVDRSKKDDIKKWSSRYGVRMLESAGLDVVYDGEQQRSEMYAWAVAHTNGFEWRGDVRAFDNKYYKKAAVTGPISLEEPYHNDEFAFLKSVAQADLKVPITGAYTIADWSFDEHYLKDDEGHAHESHAARKARRHDARRQLILDVARNMIRPNVEALIGLGARWIQIDEPGGSTDPEELEIFADSFNESVKDLDAVFSTHLCFSDYNLFFPGIEAMTACKQFCVGFANYDSRDLGTKEDDRPGYHVISKFRDLSYRPALGLGVLDIHTDFIEPPELVRDRILYAVDVFGDPARIHVTPDCGLRTRSWDVAYAKLKNMVEGVELAKKDLGL
jgi:5-methyltetrahydropteroyltriglutamate--homocysteine methyltransferase